MIKIANELLKIKAVFLNPSKPFTWASGIKSPIYTDNRVIISFTKTRDLIESSLAKLIKQKYPTVKAIVGTSTAGIPHAAYVSKIMNLPMAYVRSKVKDHGRVKAIEGELKLNTRVVVIEDLLSTGNSCLEVVKILKQNKMKVLGVVSIFTYNMKSCVDNFKKNKCQWYSLTSLDELLSVAVKEKYINSDQLSQIIKFRNNPNDDSWIKK
ncbi:MAG: orotate phosphoribosyltransferase [Mycoplasmataceae bacterium]|nr:orotate phosphoribosyltransferase [Mycoplasmataceae bacterium]